MKKNSIFFLILSIIFVMPSVFALFNPGFFLTDDGTWMVIRFSSFYEELINGQFPIRFLSRLNDGLGYPVANFLYPLFMYIGSPIHFLGFSFVDTIKIILGGSLIAGTVFSFLWLRRIFGNLESLVGSVVYSIFPYHLWDVYKRGSVGEVLALSIVPFILWQVERKNLFFVALGLVLLVLAHNSLALIFLPIIIGYMIIKKTSLRDQVFTVILSLGISAFFWLPAIYDLQYTIFSKVEVSNYREYFINFSNINLLGPIFFLVLFSGIFAFIKKKTKLFTYFFVLTILLFIATLPVSDFLWRSPLSSFIQFPFRLISVIILGIAFIAAYQISLIKNNLKLLLSFIFVVISFLSAQGFMHPNIIQNYPDSFYSTNQATTTVKNEYMPIWLNNSQDSQKIEILKGKGEIKNLSSRGSKINFDISLNERSLVQIKTAYFPGWKVYADGKDAKILYEENGLLRFNLDKGDYNIKAKFEETPLRMSANFLSLISIFTGLVVWRRKIL